MAFGNIFLLFAIFMQISLLAYSSRLPNYGFYDFCTRLCAHCKKSCNSSFFVDLTLQVSKYHELLQKAMLVILLGNMSSTLFLKKKIVQVWINVLELHSKLLLTDLYSSSVSLFILFLLNEWFFARCRYRGKIYILLSFKYLEVQYFTRSSKICRMKWGCSETSFRIPGRGLQET